MHKLQIVLSHRFEIELQNILEFYFERSPQAAENFYLGLSKKIKDAALLPYACRKNQKLNDEAIREAIFRGYIKFFQFLNTTYQILEHNPPRNFSGSTAKKISEFGYKYFRVSRVLRTTLL